MPDISMKQFLEAGVHFGHQTARWNPKMKPYIFGAKDGIYIINLEKTVELFKEACEIVKEIVAQGGKVLFVGTKKQSQETIAEEAQRCQMYYVNSRWLGGTLTNFKTIRQSVERLKKIEEMKTSGYYEAIPKKEVIKLEKEKNKLEVFLGGIREMKKLPQLIFVIDSKKERIAIREAKKLKIPTIGVVDTNADPDEVDFLIPGNDDALRAIKLYTNLIAEACIEGKALFETRVREEERKPEPVKEKAPLKGVVVETKQKPKYKTEEKVKKEVGVEIKKKAKLTQKPKE